MGLMIMIASRAVVRVDVIEFSGGAWWHPVKTDDQNWTKP
jgi:hypothetical protein